MAVELPALVVLIARKGVDGRPMSAAGHPDHRLGGADAFAQANQFRALREIAGVGHRETRERRIVGREFHRVGRSIKSEDETKCAFSQRRSVASSREILLSLRKLHFEAEQVGFEHLPGVKTSAGGRHRRFVGFHSAFDGANSLTSFAYAEIRLHYVASKLLLSGQEILLSGQRAAFCSRQTG